MLSREENELLTRDGRGTPMGDLLRRYWYPIAACSELVEKPTKAVRVLGEDLVLYRDKQGAARSDRLAVRAPPHVVGFGHSGKGRFALSLPWLAVRPKR
jgi:5,5'-dehydrodivanillate O-demethylase